MPLHHSDTKISGITELSLKSKKPKLSHLTQVMHETIVWHVLASEFCRLNQVSQEFSCSVLHIYTYFKVFGEENTSVSKKNDSWITFLGDHNYISYEGFETPGQVWIIVDRSAASKMKK